MPLDSKGLFYYHSPIGVRNLNHKRQSAPVRQAVFLYPNFAKSIYFPPLEIDWQTQCREGGEYNTLWGNNPGLLVKASEPLGTLFRRVKFFRKITRSQL